jgi:hypothetical protein
MIMSRLAGEENTVKNTNKGVGAGRRKEGDGRHKRFLWFKQVHFDKFSHTCGLA